jgi:hypothetical protein
LMDAYGDFNSEIAGNQDVAELMVNFQQEPESLCERDVVQLRHLAYRYGNIVIGAETAYSQGQITKEQFQLYLEDVSVMTELYPGLRAKLIENYSHYPKFREMDIWKRIITEPN